MEIMILVHVHLLNDIGPFSQKLIPLFFSIIVADV